MTEEEARDTVGQIVGNVALGRLETLASLVTAEANRQNLVARSTIPSLWARHILDSVQLVRFAREGTKRWLDIGTGGGFPGLAVAAVTLWPTLLVEPRRLRATFLRDAAVKLKLGAVQVIGTRIETVAKPADIISARAVAPIEKLLQAARGCSTPATRWLFLRGKITPMDVAGFEKRREMVFHVEQSLSDSRSFVVIADGKP